MFRHHHPNVLFKHIYKQTPTRIMVIAGETSGDRVAAELVTALRSEIAHRSSATTDLQPSDKQTAPRFFGAGGPAMADAGVEIIEDMMGHAVTGVTDVIRRLGNFQKLFHRLEKVAIARQPDVLICVDFSGFNTRFAKAIRKAATSRRGPFANWNPKVVQYVSPQVWGSRPGRAWKLARTFDLLLSIIPFEVEWYRKRTPNLNVRFVGHPIVDRYQGFQKPMPAGKTELPIVALLPGSRASELRRHIPPMLDAVRHIQSEKQATFEMVLPDERSLELVQSFDLPEAVHVQVGGLPELLSRATIAMASTGTVTIECTYFGVPTLAMYVFSGITFQIVKRVAIVDKMAMPNLIAKEVVFPEFIQDDATGENLGKAALQWLNNPESRSVVQAKLAKITQSLGEPGAAQRAARAVLDLF